MSQVIRLTPTAGPGSGTVTSISAGTGITLTPNPITTTGSVALTIPVAIANGGTNATAMATTFGVNYFDGTRIVTTSVGTASQVLTSNGAGVAPTFQAAAGGGVTWSVITANQTAAVNHGYFCNKAGTLALALPAVSAVGDIIEVYNMNTGLGTQFTQAAGQQIFIGNASSTLGATGTLTSSFVGDALKLVCSAANTTWRVVSGWGNWTPA